MATQIMSTAGTFDVNAFIVEVRKQNAIWNCFDPSYRKTYALQDAWMKVAGNMFIGFDELSSKKRKEIVDRLRLKWQHLRTSYRNFLKDVSNGFSTRRFWLEGKLSFLRKTFNFKKTIASDASTSAVFSNIEKLNIRNQLNITTNVSSEKRSVSETDEVVDVFLENESESLHDSTQTSESEDTDDMTTINARNAEKSAATPCLYWNENERRNYRDSSDSEDDNEYKYPKYSRKLAKMQSLKEEAVYETIYDVTEAQNLENPSKARDLKWCPMKGNSSKARNPQPYPVKRPELSRSFMRPSTILPEQPDEDMEFFRSLLTWTKKFSDDEKFKFRSEIMKLVQQVRNNEISRNYYVLSRMPRQ